MKLEMLKEGSKAAIFTDDSGNRLLAINSVIILCITSDNWLQVYSMGTDKLNEAVRYFMEAVLHSFYSIAEQSFMDKLLINVDTGEVLEL